MIDIAANIAQNRNGEAVGLPCFCTANEQVLRSTFQYVREHQVPVIVEATCNQVNQDGGYTGMTAADFANWMASMASEYHIPADRIVLGGDHLGPNPWRHLPPAEAMDRAQVLVRDYAAAGFRKIHLDASMACAGESTPSFSIVAERAARLCQVVEAHSPHPQELFYIIGTEVPIPGGETDDMDELSVTRVERLNETIDTHREAFDNHGIGHVWPRISAVVMQPGVDFSHTSVHCFEPNKASALSSAIEHIDKLSFEAHSTDYQPDDALAALVGQHFFFLKVGPELTFRMREAAFSLSSIERHLIPAAQQSGLIDSLDRAMTQNSEHWQAYYRGDPMLVEQLRHYSYSDRIRYYWSDSTVKQSLQRLMANLAGTPIPETLISQYFPQRPFGSLNVSAEQLMADHIGLCIDRYYRACGYR